MRETEKTERKRATRIYASTSKNNVCEFYSPFYS